MIIVSSSVLVKFQKTNCSWHNSIAIICLWFALSFFKQFQLVFFLKTVNFTDSCAINNLLFVSFLEQMISICVFAPCFWLGPWESLIDLAPIPESSLLFLLPNYKPTAKLIGFFVVVQRKLGNDLKKFQFYCCCTRNGVQTRNALWSLAQLVSANRLFWFGGNSFSNGFFLLFPGPRSNWFRHSWKLGLECSQFVLS